MRHRRGFSLIEIVVVIGIMALLMAIILPVMEKVRHRGYLQACASNLRSIGQAMAIYADENHGQYPRTLYVPDAPIAYGSPAPAANDITAAVFLLLKTQKLPAKIFICPYNDVFVYEADGGDLSSRNNFTDYRKNFGYSIANMYPSSLAAQSGYKWTNQLSETFAIAADKNPGVKGNGDDVDDAVPGASEAQINRACSSNHEKDGQNVLYGDGHVAWQFTPLCGMNQDNIYTNKSGQIDASPVDKDDAILLPTDDP